MKVFDRRHEKTHSGVVEGGYTRGQIIAQDFLSQENQEGWKTPHWVSEDFDSYCSNVCLRPSFSVFE